MNDPFQKDILKRKIGAMENRIKAKAAKEREQEVLRRHRKDERQKVESGKNPLLPEEERAQGASAGGEVQEHEGQGPRKGNRQEAQEGESKGDQEDARCEENGGLKIVHPGYANTSIGGCLAVNDTMIPFFECDTCRHDHMFPTCHHHLLSCFRWRVSETPRADSTSLERTHETGSMLWRATHNNIQNLRGYLKLMAVLT
jgi:hypothetical protein